MLPDDANAHLFAAAQSGNLTAALTALAAGADVNAKNSSQQTALHWAALTGHIELARALIERGADVRAEDKHGVTPKQLASYAGNPDLVPLLAEAAPPSYADTVVKNRQRPGHLVGDGWIARASDQHR